MPLEFTKLATCINMYHLCIMQVRYIREIKWWSLNNSILLISPNWICRVRTRIKKNRMPNNKFVNSPAAMWIERILAMPRSRKIALVMCLDIFASIFACYLAFALRLGDWDVFRLGLMLFTLLSVSMLLPTFLWRNIYNAIMRYSGIRSVIDISAAIAIAAIPAFCVFGIYGVTGVPRTVTIIQPIILFIILTSSRVFARYILVDVLKRRTYGGEYRRTVIYGAGNAGLQLANSMRQEAGIYLCAFLDDDKRLAQHRIDSVPVWHSSDISAVIDKFSPTDIFLAMPNISRRKRQNIIDSLNEYPVRVMTLPNLQQIVDGKVSVNDLRQVEIEDLLGRDPVAANELLMSKNITGKIVMVTGAGGSIGSELCRHILLSRPAKLILVEMSEHALYQIEDELCETKNQNPTITCEIVSELANISNADTVNRLMQRWQPQTLFHAAAYKHVPIVEANPIAGLHNNIIGTLNCAQAAQAAQVRHFILVSTDKAVRPTNIMGASKRACELILQAFDQRGSNTIFSMVRFGNVLGSSGSVVPKFRSQIEAGGPITLTHKDITRYFMTIPEAAQLVIQAGAMAKGGEVFVLDMGEPIKIIDLAASMVRLSGLSLRSTNNPDGDIEIIETGLRPGEKLYEELLIGDNPEATSHPRIMRANETMVAWDILSDMLEKLNKILNERDAGGAIEVLKEIVVEYTPPKTQAVDRQELLQSAAPL